MEMKYKIKELLVRIKGLSKNTETTNVDYQYVYVFSSVFPDKKTMETALQAIK